MPGADFAARCLPATHVGGDYYDFLRHRGGAVSAIVADVSGHGLGPGLLMSTVRGALRSELFRSASLADALVAANQVMWDDLVATEAFITLFVTRYEPHTQLLHYVNAGHQPALLCHADGSTEELDSDGVPIGILEDASFEQQTRQLAPGDVVLVVSDGVVETVAPDGSFFGADGVEAVLRRCRARPSTETVAALLAALAERRGEHPQADDVTVVGLRVLEPGAAEATRARTPGQAA